MSGQLKQIDFKISCKSLLRWAYKEDFKGFDPYDGLNTPIFNFEFLRNKYFMIIVTQFFKNFPINIRFLFGIKKERNSKGIALFVLSLLNLFRKYKVKEYLNLSIILLDWLQKNRSEFAKNFAWGYNFPWQSRNSFKPRNFPNIVTTSFVGLAFLEAYKITKCEKYLKIAVSSCRFIVEELNITEKNNKICFSYSPADNEAVYNATLLASLLLISVWEITGIEEFKDKGIKSVYFSIEAQNIDGSWYYGENQNQKWIDNFHTGYNLWALKKINDIIKDDCITSSIDKGLDYYIKNLFTDKFYPKYYHNKKYPFDIHCYAVASIVFCEFNMIDYAKKILNLAISDFLSSKGYFYYRKNMLFLNKIPYMRWSNAWMLYALTEVLKYEDMD